MKRAICLLMICMTFMLNAACVRLNVPAAACEQTAAEETTEEKMTLAGTVEQAVTEIPKEAPEDDPEDWRKKARALLQAAEAPTYADRIGDEFIDQTQDGVQEILRTCSEYEAGGMDAIWTWYNGKYVQAYALTLCNGQRDFDEADFRSLRGTQSGQITKAC